MKLSALDVWNMHMSLEVTKGRAAPMPDKAKWWLTRLARKLRPEFDSLNEQRDEMIKGYGKKNKNGVFEVMPEDNDDFNERWKTILKEEIDIDGVDPRLISFFRLSGEDASKDNGPLSVAEMIALEPLLLEGPDMVVTPLAAVKS